MLIEEIDNGIKDLVSTLNKIPFIKTVESCEGHLEKTIKAYDSAEIKDYIMTADKGYKYIRPGALLFKIDNNIRYNSFLKSVKRLVEEYSFASLTKNEKDGKSHYTIILDCSDITKVKSINLNNDDFETVVKKMHQVKTEIGEKRIALYKSFWNELLEIAKKYTK